MGLLIKFVRLPLVKKLLLMFTVAIGIYAIMRPDYMKEAYAILKHKAKLTLVKSREVGRTYIFKTNPDSSTVRRGLDFKDSDSFTAPEDMVKLDHKVRVDDVALNQDDDEDQDILADEDDDQELLIDNFGNLGDTLNVDPLQIGYNLSPPKPSPQLGKKKNVLFLIADDLRPQIGAYFGRDYATPYDKRKLHTPNIDKLAEKSLVLKRAYTQYSLCGPSRASLLTSRRPDTTKVYQNFVYWRDSGGNFTTLPQYFKQFGYASVGLGKVFHVDGHKSRDDPISWTVPPFQAPNVHHVNTAGVNWASVSETKREKEPLEDEITVMQAAKVLRKLAPRALTGEKPFFMALGFYRPHVPQICPAEFFKLYPVESKSRFMAEKAWQSPKLDPYCGMAPLKEGVNNSALTHIPEEALRELRAAYFACVSYVDYLIGSVLNTLDELQLSDSTIVSLVADHGFHLGENNWYSKYTSHDIALHVPLIIRIPGRTDEGIESRSLVELLDIFPTIVDAAGLPKVKQCPEISTNVKLCTEGRSLLQLLKKPHKPIRAAAYSQVSRGRDITEYSVRTDRYRFTDFAFHRRIEREHGLYKHQLFWDVDTRYSDLQRMLYDHDKDPEERVNVIDDADYAPVVKKLQDRLQQKFSVVHDYPDAVYQAYE